MIRPVLQRAAIAFLVVAAMATIVLVGFPLCPTATVLHIPCPGCGMTRATLAALHGDFRASFRFHPLAMIFSPLLGVYFLAHGVSYIRHGTSRVDEVITGKWIDRLLLLLLVALLALWVARFFGAFGGPAPV